MSDPPKSLEFHVARHEAELSAIRHWLCQLYKHSFAHMPAMHATEVRRHIQELKNTDPGELTDMPTEGREFVWHRLLPELEELGNQIAEALEGLASDAQRSSDGRRT